MADHVSGQPGLKETGAVSDRESVATTIVSSQSKGKRDRNTYVVHSLKDREYLQKILERKADSAVRGEMMAQRKLYEAEAKARQIGKRENPTLLFKRSIMKWNLRFQVHQASRWADQAQRETRFVCMENMENWT